MRRTSVAALLVAALSASGLASLPASGAPIPSGPSESSAHAPAHRAVVDDPQGCGYGEDGPSHATLCWIDASGLDEARMRSPEGQPVTVRPSPDVLVSFVARVGPGADGYRPISAAPFPTYRNAALGTTAYRNTPGSPAFYQDVSSDPASTEEQGYVMLDDIKVTHADGTPIKGYGVVIADAESTNDDEEWKASSDQPLKLLANIPARNGALGCPEGLEGIGTTSVTCIGGVGRVGALEVYAEAPKRVRADFVNSTETSRQGAAFALLLSKVSLTKRFDGLANPGDSVLLDIANADGRSVASGSTGGGTSGGTGSTTVGAGRYTFSEKGQGNTSLANYDAEWTCTREGETVPGFPSTGGTSKALDVPLGAEVECAVTNASKPAELRVEKSVMTSPTRPGNTVTYTVVIRNTGTVGATSAVAVDDLTESLLHATYLNDATVTRGPGEVRVEGKKLVWEGDLPAKGEAVLTYSMKVKKPGAWTNSVTLSAPHSNCEETSSARAAECADTTKTVARDGIKKARQRPGRD